jgi:hypothetical protein
MQTYLPSRRRGSANRRASQWWTEEPIGDGDIVGRSPAIELRLPVGGASSDVRT